MAEKIGRAFAALEHYAGRWEAAEEANPVLLFARLSVSLAGLLLIAVWLLD